MTVPKAGPAPMVSRRTFIKTMAASSGVLAVAAVLPDGVFAAEGGSTPAFPHDPVAFVRIAADNTVTVILKHLEYGQGVATGLATLVAEELDADWSQMRTEFAPAQVPLYGNLAWGETVQGTGASTSIANSWEELRYSGAAARQMLVAAAAAQWHARPDDIVVEGGVVKHAKSGRHATFGALAAEAARQPVPIEVALKDPSTFKLIGKSDIKRIDSLQKINGLAKFASDFRRPGMLRAVIARPPRFGAKLRSFDAKKAKAVKGVVEVVEVAAGVAVVASDSWSAIRGREMLKIDWDDSAAERRSTGQIMAEYKAAGNSRGVVVNRVGDSSVAMAGSAKEIEAEYTFPYLAHAPMEPLNAIVELKEGGAEIWAGSQLQTLDQGMAAQVLGLKPEQVKLHTVWAGGSFGRRATPNADYIGEAASIVKATGGKTPIHLVWTREDDLRGGRYRPMSYHKLRAGLDAEGHLISWEHRIVTQSIQVGTPLDAPLRNGLDIISAEGAANQPYGVPNQQIDVHILRSPVPVLWWRSAAHSHTGYAVESFIDEAAHAAGKDPVAFRLGLLSEQPRLAKVLRLAADKAGWDTPLPQGRGRGCAVVESFNTAVAQVAEVSIGKDGKIKVDRVVCAVDCGIAVNPDQVRSQMEGGIGFGLGAVLRNAITLADGRVEQGNFDSYVPLRLSDMPRIDVYVIDSGAHPSGVGEAGVPPIGPAVANAIFAATGRRLRDLPLSNAKMV
jgi:isoquinoline 1-oxidoreductase beta subunit